MFARVIPLLRTPYGVDAFDYRLPDGLTVAPGDLVTMPFRRQNPVGLVTEVLDKSPFSARALDITGSYAGLKFPKKFLDFIQWTSRRTFCSCPTILDAFFRKLPKKPKALSPLIFDQAAKLGSMESFWQTDPWTALVVKAKEAKQTGRVLILTPWKHRAERLADELNTTYLTGDLADGAAFQVWQNFLADDKGCLVSTRLGGWLAPLVDTVLIDEPGTDDHKQDDLAPRYDVRRLAAWAATHAGVRVEAFGVTPPLHIDDPAPTLEPEIEIIPRLRAGWSNIPMIEAAALEHLRAHEGPRIIIHPIRGEAARFTCRDCGWTALCEHCQFPVSAATAGAVCRRCGRKGETPLACANCSGTDLGKSLPGIDRLKRSWTTHEPEIQIEWRGIAPAEIDQPLPAGVMVLVTDGGLLAIGGTEDIRRRERTAVAFRLLAAAVLKAKGKLLIQTSESNSTDWETWLVSESFAAFRQSELRDRQLFEYPPTVRLYKAILPTDTADDWGRMAQKSLDDVAKLRGPFPVTNRPTSRGARSIWHILPKASVPEDEMIERLGPLSLKSVILDLDPIAFFR